MYRLALGGRAFESEGVWAQLEAAHALGFELVAFTGPQSGLPDAGALQKYGLAVWNAKDTSDPASLYEQGAPSREALCALLKDATCVRMRDFGYADGLRTGRRIGHGVVDWIAILSVLRQTGFDGVLLVDPAPEGHPTMESGRALAAVSREDVRALLDPRPPMTGWHVVSPDVPGLHEVISPRKSDCRALSVYRLNLVPGESFVLRSGDLEMNAVLVSGTCRARCEGRFDETLQKLDAFYIPGEAEVSLHSESGCVLYIAGARCEGLGSPFVQRFDPSLPLGDVHQIHGSGAGQREVFFTLNPQQPASRLICGLTWGDDGAWTSWPAHQHEQYLEEAYCYFDIDRPCMGFHLSYAQSGDLYRAPVLHPVRGGHFVLAPRGYHPTVAAPGVRNAYFWALAAFEPEGRRYDLAETDPALG